MNTPKKQPQLSSLHKGVCTWIQDPRFCGSKKVLRWCTSKMGEFLEQMSDVDTFVKSHTWELSAIPYVETNHMKKLLGQIHEVFSSLLTIGELEEGLGNIYDIFSEYQLDGIHFSRTMGSLHVLNALGVSKEEQMFWDTLLGPFLDQPPLKTFKELFRDNGFPLDEDTGMTYKDE